MFDLNRLTAETAWIASIDSDWQLDVCGRALWAVFAAATADVIPYHAQTCTDVLTPEAEQRWTAWDDATEEERDQARCFRWIVASN